MRAFVRMRAMLSDTRELARKLAALETELKTRLDVHETAIVDILQRVMEILYMASLMLQCICLAGFQPALEFGHFR